ncbi:MAG: LCP family protein [Erysipelotrichaceae bacterium]
MLIVLCLFSGCKKEERTGSYYYDYHRREYNNGVYYYNTDIINFLFIGTDNDINGTAQADALFLLSVKRSSKQARCYLIDRNTYTLIRTFDEEGNDLGWNENYLSLSYAYGSSLKNSVLLTSDAVSSLFNDIPISYYLCADIDNIYLFHKLVKELEVVLPNDSLTEIDGSLVKGSSYLITEDNVEEYLRYRNTDIEGSNIERLERQKAYLEAFTRKINDIQTDKDELISILDKFFCNIESSELSYFMELFTDLDIEFVYLPGENIRDRIRDRFVVDRKKLEEEIVNYFYTK